MLTDSIALKRPANQSGLRAVVFTYIPLKGEPVFILIIPAALL